MVDGDVNFNNLSNIFIRPYAENVQRIILVIEDFGKKDAAVQGTMYNPSCLNFLDGTAGLFRVPTMILCTTNFAKDLGPQLTNRPGRFNKIIQVLPPSDEEIFDLVEGIGNIKLSEEQKQAFRGRNMTPDHVIEAIIRHELEDITLEQSVNEVLGERQGLVSW
jgi:SpoVK/Ycf46/Vps4 family AAA+-type ATPase